MMGVAVPHLMHDVSIAASTAQWLTTAFLLTMAVLSRSPGICCSALPPEARGRTMGNISIVISVAPAIGPTISGLILSGLEWRWMFILVLPIAVGALALGATMIKNVSEPTEAPLDIISVLLSIVGFGGFVYGLSVLGE